MLVTHPHNADLGRDLRHLQATATSLWGFIGLRKPTTRPDVQNITTAGQKVVFTRNWQFKGCSTLTVGSRVTANNPILFLNF